MDHMRRTSLFIIDTRLSRLSCTDLVVSECISASNEVTDVRAAVYPTSTIDALRFKAKETGNYDVVECHCVRVGWLTNTSAITHRKCEPQPHFWPSNQARPTWHGRVLLCFAKRPGGRETVSLVMLVPDWPATELCDPFFPLKTCDVSSRAEVV